jgi:hypothetical protein
MWVDVEEEITTISKMRTSSVTLSQTQNQDWNEAKTMLENNTFYIVHRNGPTVLNVRGEADETVYRVMIGNPHSCSCKRTMGFCVHILFVILKVFRIPESHPLAKKITLTDSEIDQALIGNFEGRVKPIAQRKEKKIKNISKETDSLTAAEETVERQPMDDENPDICPICQDDMTKDDALTWCRKGCGNNIHAKCMKLYAQYKTTNTTTILCPLCREDWGPQAMQILQEDCKGKASLKKACSTSQCFSCTFQIRGDLYRCIECSFKAYTLQLDQSHPSIAAPSAATTTTLPPSNSIVKKNQNKIQPVDFCSRCFQNITRDHMRHHFLTASSTELLMEFEWKYVKNPRAPQQLVDEKILNTLQQRDLTDEDYDLLLGLDQKADAIPLQKVLVDSLPKYKPADGTSSQTSSTPVVCWCTSRARVSTSDDTPLKIYQLPCGHPVHEECISALLHDAVREGSWKLDDILCGHVDCRVAVFKGISRRRFKAKKEESVTTIPHDQQPSGHSPSEVNSLVSGISGLSIQGRTSQPPSVQGSRSSTTRSQQQPGLVRSTSRSQFQQRHLELQQRLEELATNHLSINQLCIGGNSTTDTESQGIGVQVQSGAPKLTRPPRHIVPKKKIGSTLSMSRNLRSRTDDQLDDDIATSITGNSVNFAEGAPRTRIGRAHSVDRSSQHSQAPHESVERRNRIPIRTKFNESVNQPDLSDGDTASLTLGGVGFIHQSFSSQALHANNIAAPVTDAPASRKQQTGGKRIKSSPASILAAKRKSHSEINSTTLSQPQPEESLQLSVHHTLSTPSPPPPCPY